MGQTSSPRDVTQSLVYLLLSALLLGLAVTQDVAPHVDKSLATQGDLTHVDKSLGTHGDLLRVDKPLDKQSDLLADASSTLATVNALTTDTSTFDSLDVLSNDNDSLATQDVLSLESLTIGKIDSLPNVNNSLAIMDALSQDNSSLGTLDEMPVASSTLATQNALLPDRDSTTIDPASCDHMESCHTGMVCGCYYYKRRDRLGRLLKGDGCRKMINCSKNNLSLHTLLNINFSQFNDTILDINLEGNDKLRVHDIDSVGQYIYNNTVTENTLIYFGPLENLPCPTRIHITRRWGFDNSMTEVLCNNRNLTDQRIDDIVFPSLTKHLWLEHNKLTLRARLEVKMQSLQHLVKVDLSFNKLTAIPRVNVSTKIGDHFSLDLTNNSIREYDSTTLEQYAPKDDTIHISLENNSFVCDCEAYYTNEVFVKHGVTLTRDGQYKCLMPDDSTGEMKLISLPRKEDKYWKNRCEGWVDKTGYIYLIFTWHNLLDFCLILANVFVIYIVYDLYMAIKETRLKRVDTKVSNVRRDSNKSSKSIRKESNSALRKISKFSRKGSQAESVSTKSHSHAPRRPLLDVIVCKIKKGFKNLNNFIHTIVFSKKVQVLDEEENGSTNDEKEEDLLREFALERMRNSQNYDTKL